MKSIYFLLTCIFLGAVNGNAQLLSKKVDSTMEANKVDGPSKPALELFAAIRPSAYSPAFNKTKTTAMSRLKEAADLPAIVENTMRIASEIKTAQFANPTSQVALYNKISAAKTVTQFYAALAELEDGMKDQSFTSIWQMQKSNWLATLK